MSAPRSQKISEITRRNLIDQILLEMRDAFPNGRFDLISFLSRVWPLTRMPSRDPRFEDAQGDIRKHMILNDDWTEYELLVSRLEMLEIPDQQFGCFLETLVHPLNLPDKERQAAHVEMLNKELQNDGYELRKIKEISSRPVFQMSAIAKASKEIFDVVLSFAGENRNYVEAVAENLKVNQIKFFYDEYEEAFLWGKNQAEQFHDIYSRLGRYCVMFISEAYANKVWPTYERRSAFEKAVQSKEEYILPARFDDTEIPGLHKHISYVDLRRKTPQQLAKLIVEKLGRPAHRLQETKGMSDFIDDDIPF